MLWPHIKGCVDSEFRRTTIVLLYWKKCLNSAALYGTGGIVTHMGPAAAALLYY